MQRISTITKVLDFFGVGKHGFRDGDLATGILPTDLNAAWFNGAQEELLSVVEGAGIAADGAVLTQVRQAIKRLAGGNVTTVNAANSPYALTADNAGLVLMDATAGNIVANLPAVNAVTAAKLIFDFVRIDASAAYMATVNRAGGDTFVGGTTSFTLAGQSDYRSVVGDTAASWVTRSLSSGSTSDYKASCRLATTANIASLAGGTPNTLDGIALVVADRILVKDQADASKNGLYVVTTLGTGANGTWSRASDADQAGELTPGAQVTVEEGTAAADSTWELSTDGTITIGTTALTFIRTGSSTVKQIQSITSSVAGNQLTVGLNPTTLDFRSSSLTTGVPNTRTVGSALSLVVPASATLGTINATAARLVLLAIDNAGTVELAIVNLAGGVNLDETTLISTTAISAAATSGSVVYSTTARTNVPYRVVGFLDITETIAGTWAVDATAKQGAGGQALAAMSSLGYGQKWTDFTGSRAIGTTYYNTTGKPIQVSVNVSPTVTGHVWITVGGVQMDGSGYPSSGTAVEYVTAIIPPGNSYVVNSSGATLNSWSELR